MISPMLRIVLLVLVLTQVVLAEVVELEVDINKDYIVPLEIGDFVKLKYSEKQVTKTNDQPVNCFSAPTSTEFTSPEFTGTPIKFTFETKFCLLGCTCTDKDGSVVVVLATPSPTATPTQSPSKSPTKFPTTSPTHSPTEAPTSKLSRPPTVSPTRSPTSSPTEIETTGTGNGGEEPGPDASQVPFLATVITVSSVVLFGVGALARKRHLYNKLRNEKGDDGHGHQSFMKFILGKPSTVDKHGSAGTNTKVVAFAMGDEEAVKATGMKQQKRFSPIRRKPSPMVTADCPKYESLTNSDLDFILGRKKTHPKISKMPKPDFEQHRPSPTHELPVTTKPAPAKPSTRPNFRAKAKEQRKVNTAAAKAAEMRLDSILMGPVDPSAAVAAGASEEEAEKLLAASIHKNLERRKIEGTLKIRGGKVKGDGTMPRKPKAPVPPHATRRRGSPVEKKRLNSVDKATLIAFLRDCEVVDCEERANVLAKKYKKSDLIGALIKLYGTAPPSWML